MMLNIKLEGFPESILNEMVDLGIASNKTEAIRLALIHYNEHFHLMMIEQYKKDLAAIEKMEEQSKEIKSGKAKPLSEDDVLKKYPHLRD